MKKILFIALFPILFSCEESIIASVSEVVTPLYVYIILDGSGSSQNLNTRPNRELLVEILTHVSQRGAGGKIWVDYIDMDCKGNKIIYTKIDTLPKPPFKPEKKAGDFDFSLDIDDYSKSYSKYEKDSSDYIKRLKERKAKFEKEVDSLLNVVYKVKSKNEDYSDSHCILNLAYESLSQCKNGDKYIIAFSDLLESLPKNGTKKLETKPKEVKIFSVGYRDISKPKFIDKDLENSQRIFEELN